MTVILVLCAGTLNAATIHVPGNAPTIQDGINRVRDGDTVLVGPGTYVENIVVYRGRNLISTHGAAATIITPAEPLDVTVGLGGSQMTPGSARTEFAGFTVTGGGLNSATVRVWGGDATVVRDCVFRDNIPDTSSTYTVVQWSARGGILTRNVFHDNGGFSFGLYPNRVSVAVLNNTLVGNHNVIYVHHTHEEMILRNNIIVNSSGLLFYLTPYAANRVDNDYNNVWNNVFDDSLGLELGPHAISFDPLFVDSGDYRLQPTSPCIDAGDPDSAHNDPDGSRNDIGAYPSRYEVCPRVQNVSFGPDAVFCLIRSLMPEFHWSLEDTCGGSQTAFELEVGSDNDWSVAEMWSTGVLTSSDTQISYAGVPLEDPNTYFLRLRVSDGANWSEWFNTLFSVQLPGILYVPEVYSTLSVAISSASDGDLIRVGPGTYAEGLDFDGKEISVVSTEGPEMTFLEPPDGDTPAVLFISGEGPDAVLSGFTIRGALKEPAVLVDGSSPTIRNNVFRHNWISPYFYEAPLRVTGESSSPSIHHNVFDSNDGIANVYIQSPAQFYNNTIINSRSGGVLVSDDGADVRNNLIVRCSDYGISFVDESQPTIDYNNVFGNNPNYNQSEPGQNDISLDPMFVEPEAGDYRLHPESPCIDAGDPDPYYSDPDGSRNDIGASHFYLSGPIIAKLNFGPTAFGDTATSMQPEFFWNYIDVSGPQSLYEIEIGTDTNWSAAEIWSSGQVLSSDTHSVYTGPPLVEGGQYYSRVRAGNGSALSPWRQRVLVVHSVFSRNVPDEYQTIQSAIDASIGRDTVVVHPGTYVENLDYLGKSIVLLSSGGAGLTVLQPADPFDHVVHFSGGEDTATIFGGFTVENCSTSAVLASNVSQPVISHNIIRNNSSTGIEVFSPSNIEYNIVYGNLIGIYSRGPSRIVNNTVVSNGDGLMAASGSYAFIIGNILAFNTNYGQWGWVNNPDYNDHWSNGSNGSGGEHTIYEDPLFVDAAAFDFRLLPNSPCINAGHPDDEYNDPDGSRSDIGAIPLGPLSTNVQPDTLFAYQANSIAPDSLAIYLGNLINGMSVTDIDLTSLFVNDSLAPTSWLVLDAFPGYTSEVLVMYVPLRAFIQSYGIVWDESYRSYRIDGQYTDATEFTYYGTFTLIGHISGDLNNDGQVDISDLVYLVDFCFHGGPAPSFLEGADLDHNGTVDISDLVSLVDRIFVSGP